MFWTSSSTKYGMNMNPIEQYSVNPKEVLSPNEILQPKELSYKKKDLLEILVQLSLKKIRNRSAKQNQ